jgi:hypothetical protein
MTTVLQETLARIAAAFADTPRPADDDLLHERCFDDNDIVRLYPVAHWTQMPDELIEAEYAALSFLSPAGFRHFIPAYMSFALRHLGSGAAAVHATIWSLSPDVNRDPELRAFAVSKLSQLTGPERAAAVAFLGAIGELGDAYDADEAGKALDYWRNASAG